MPTALEDLQIVPEHLASAPEDIRTAPCKSNRWPSGLCFYLFYWILWCMCISFLFILLDFVVYVYFVSHHTFKGVSS